MTDPAPLTLTGYRFSVYTRSVAMALHAKGVCHTYKECDPFDPVQARALLGVHPFGRVPVLQHGDFTLWETAAILHYSDTAFPGPVLTPDDLRGAARMRQVMGIADAYVYGPLVRGAVSNALFAPLEGTPPDTAALDAGLTAAPRVLDALNDIAAEGLTLRPGHLCLGACQLWPMLDYFTKVDAGAAMLTTRLALAAWAAAMGEHPAAICTRPDLTILTGDPQ
ncbi:glutathione S-transferase family protein [Rhodobacteraceae bacterium KMM 6894]|nr:glutathione S-transferase family protein [Rhodobacteraceae bacterium KMM 6894]